MVALFVFLLALLCARVKLERERESFLRKQNNKYFTATLLCLLSIEIHTYGSEEREKEREKENKVDQ